MEQAFGHDFGDVRVHTDRSAAALSRRVSAEALTVGTDVFFKAGAYETGSTVGKELLAHELAHVVQQRGATAGSARPAVTSAPGDPAERAADAAAAAATRGGQVAGGAPRSLAAPRQLVQRRDVDRAAPDEEGSVPDQETWTTIIPSQKFNVRGREFKVTLKCRPRAGTGEDPRPFTLRPGTSSAVNPKGLLESAVTALELGTSTRIGGLTVSLKLGLLEDKLRASGGREITLAEIGLTVGGTVNAEQALELLGLEVSDDVVLEVEGKLSTDLGPDLARNLQRYLQAMDDMERAARNLDRVEAQRRATGRQIDETQRRRRDLQRRLRRNPTNVALTRELDRTVREERRLRGRYERLTGRAEQLQRRIATAADDAARATTALNQSRIGRGLRGGLGRRAVQRLGSLLFRVLPFVNIALLLFDLFSLARMIYALITGRAKFGLDEGADRLPDQPGEETEAPEAEGEAGEPDTGVEGMAEGPHGETEGVGGEAPRGEPDGAEADGVEPTPATRLVLDVLRAETGVELRVPHLERLNEELPPDLSADEAAAIAEYITEAGPLAADELVRRIIDHIKSGRAASAEQEGGEGFEPAGERTAGEAAGSSEAETDEAADTDLLPEPLRLVHWDADERHLDLLPGLQERVRSGEFDLVRGDGVIVNWTDVDLTTDWTEVHGSDVLIFSISLETVVIETPDTADVEVGDDLPQAWHFVLNPEAEWVEEFTEAAEASEKLHAAVAISGDTLELSHRDPIDLGFAVVRPVDLVETSHVGGDTEELYAGVLIVATLSVAEPDRAMLMTGEGVVTFEQGSRTRLPIRLVQRFRAEAIH